MDRKRKSKHKLSDFTIKLATPRDVNELTEMRHAMFEEMRHRTPLEHKLGDRAYKKFVAEMIRQKRFAAFIARTQKGEAVASGAVWLRESHPFPSTKIVRKAPYLLSMYTKPDYRGLGLATKIIDEAKKWSKKKGYARMSLHASEMGRRLYKSLGWERTWEMRINL